MHLLRGQRGGIVTRVVFMILLPVAAGIVGLYWYALGGRYISTDNAYIKADMIAISTSIDGRVSQVMVEDHRPVKKGDLLFVLDARPHEIARKRARAQMVEVRNKLASKRAEYDAIHPEMEDKRERVKFLKRQKQRQEDLAAKGMTTAASVDEIAYDVIEAEQALRGLQQKARRVLAELGGELDRPIEEHGRYLEAVAALEEAELALDYTVVRAPAAGIVSHVQLQPGEWVEEGRPVFRLIASGEMWIEANLKETQLTHIEVGQSVDVEIDAYPDIAWKGVISRISPATGSEFMVLPPQNATGNWIKVVQRIPVRVEIERTADDPELRAGMTVTVAVDTHRERELLSVLEGIELFTVARDAVASIGQ